jgi:O-antigen ligase
MLLSALLSDRRTDACVGLLNFLPFFLVFAGLRELIQTGAQLRRIAWLLTIGSIPVVAIGLGQEWFGWAGQGEILWVLFKWDVQAGGNPPERMSSLFFYANVLGSYLIVTFTTTLGLWLELLPRFDWGKGLKFPQILTAILTLTLVGTTIALILTESRNAWAIVLLTILAFAFYLGWRWLVAGVGAIAAMIAGAAFAPTPLRTGLRQLVPAFFWARLTDELFPDRPIAQLRTTQWQFALTLTQQQPWLGWGLRSFSPLYQAQQQIWIGHPHNLFLMLMCETGLPATLLLVGLVGWIVAESSWNLWFAPTFQDDLMWFTILTAFLGCALFGLLDVTLFDVRINAIGWLLLAAIGGVSDRGRDSPPVLCSD